MNILVLSDSHGNLSNMEEAVERERPQLILHLGDCWRDAERLAERYPNIPMEHVPGNCDCRPEEPAEKLLFLGDCRVLICHGHTYGVKTSLLAAGLKAEQDQLDAFLFGHTHAADRPPGKDPVPESRLRRQGTAAHICRADRRGRETRRADGVSGLTARCRSGVMMGKRPAQVRAPKPRASPTRAICSAVGAALSQPSNRISTKRFS